jgi:hypothetical protein
MENLVRQVIPASELLTIVSNLGLAPGFSSIYSSNAAPDSGFMMVALKSTHKVSTFVYIHRLKKLLPQAVPEMRTFFTSGSIIDSVLNFGLAAPIDVQLTAPTYRALFPVAPQSKAPAACPRWPTLSFHQEADYPTLRSKSTGSRRRAWA